MEKGLSRAVTTAGPLDESRPANKGDRLLKSVILGLAFIVRDLGGKVFAWCFGCDGNHLSQKCPKGEKNGGFLLSCFVCDGPPLRLEAEINHLGQTPRREK